MKPSLQLKIGHQLTMTPQLQQAIRLLQLSAVDLQTEIQTALEANPMLEIQEQEISQDTASQEDTSEEDSALNFYAEPDPNGEEFTWEVRLGTKREAHFHESLGNELETLNSVPITLRDHLVWQMELTPFSENDLLIAAAIIDSINEDGFLTCDISDIQATVQDTVEVNTQEVEAVLHRIQQFDPLGVGARNIGESLKVQLEHLAPDFPWRDKAKELVMHHLELLGKRDYAALRRRLGLSMEELHEVIQCIQSLNPRPGTEIGGSSAEYVIPDVYTYKKHGKWVVELNPECMPKLRINDHYAGLIRRADSSQDNQYLRNQLQEARWFLKSIENRNDTLFKVASCIILQQQDFLEHGEEAMKPLILHDVAKVLELHESTISRVTTQKYLHTPRGTFELKYFFSSHVNTEKGGECSATAIRAVIKKLIAAESRKKPLSDSKLAKMLAELGIPVARRTVAKYREAMNIAPSNERKQLI